MSLLAKWTWRYGVEKDALWRRVIAGKYGRNQECITPWIISKPQGVGVWKGVQKGKDIIIQNSVLSIKNGSRSIYFWFDKWCGPQSLKELFPDVFKISRYKRASIADNITKVNATKVWNVSFKREVNEEELRRVLALLLFIRDPPNLVEGAKDNRNCLFGKGNEFSVKQYYDFLNREEPASFPVKLIWRKEIPSKVSIMVWAAMYNAIPTIDVLRRRGFQIVNRCWFCKKNEESISHLFLHCSMAT
ncbi:Reverse transcriptase zinc-binding domain [Macleaya cordata]|uniref:Reverse transcriptase zinc-binding domain n=1 Tax=Macleaya cordata TaxID=56857 RepID=A0A200Q1A2_MACCD|nr:Reverse transcriptase zinc-binding domain [Macleaya cordata]